MSAGRLTTGISQACHGRCCRCSVAIGGKPLFTYDSAGSMFTAYAHAVWHHW
ncbi:hypothetical protein THER5_2029 [Bifidobacterium thermacidophilum subsp. thermacidophilum]|uniref:Uncharacterized protein n=1 Tax=Bifidobacterium thermacidophilum subsp. thermacidophilum TaxID=79262 RepID=A0A087E320_9BIFI|nr:hypothetical protein THER5_2029 [Bifidobacterium thermacidophilum subsp. thermacidophilum]